MAGDRDVEAKDTKESIKLDGIDFGDGTLEVLDAHHVDHPVAHALLWKIDLRLMPLM